jgi:DNA processing protein
VSGEAAGRSRKAAVTGGERTGVSILACDACLRRTWLIAALAGHIERARHDRRDLPEILALADEDLIVAVGGGGGGGGGGGALRRQIRALDPRHLRRTYEAMGLSAVCRHDERYPARLRDAGAPPAVVAVAGGLSRLGVLAGGDVGEGGGAGEGAPAVAVVGTRRASADGLEVARALGRGLAAAGVTVVSGMALGVDSAAHAGALDVNGPTVAVLAGGADVPYPASKRGVYRRIVERGCVVSEMPPGFVARRWCFPARNRIIAALGRATIVVEAAERSGSLITAELAMDLGRDVGAVPGPVLSWRSRGTNALLRDGATLVRDALDALDLVLGVGHGTGTDADARHAALSPDLRALLDAVEHGRDTVDAIAGEPARLDETLVGLTELELLGLVRREPDGRYRRLAA